MSMYCLVHKQPEGKNFYCDTDIRGIRQHDVVMVKLAGNSLYVAPVVDIVPILPHPEESVFSVVRRASSEDLAQQQLAESKASEALVLCREAVEQLNLPMRIIKAELLLSFKKYVFYFTAPERVDFRPLLAVLTTKMKENIELRQIGVRNAVKMLGAVGVCGQSCCCGRYKQYLDTISAKTLKGLCAGDSFARSTGVCGRLQCCTVYEQK